MEALKQQLAALTAQFLSMLSGSKLHPVEQMIRRVCAEELMTPEQTEIIVAVIKAESGLNTKAVNHNRKNGVIVSSDFGLCQLNNYWYRDKIGFPDEALNNPEKCVKIMCTRVKQPNGINDWIAYRNGSWKRYYKLPLSS